MSLLVDIIYSASICCMGRQSPGQSPHLNACEGIVSDAFGSPIYSPRANLLLFVLTMLFLFALDITMQTSRIPKPRRIQNVARLRWFVLHAVGNTIVCIMTAQCVFRALSDPLLLVSHPELIRFDASSTIACTLHLYHVIFFTCSTKDWVHHISFVAAGFIGQWICGSYTGHIAGLYHFFVTGLPGAIDYTLLSAVEIGSLSKAARVSVAVEINTWLRSPGLLFAFTMSFCRMRQHSLFGCIFGFFLCVFNGQYYMQEVLLAAGNRYEVKKGVAKRVTQATYVS